MRGLRKASSLCTPAFWADCLRLGGTVRVGAVGGCRRPAAARRLLLSFTSGAPLCAPCPRWPCLVLWGAPCSSYPLMLVLGWLPARGSGCTLLRHAALPAPPCPPLSPTDSNASRALHPALVVINDGTTQAPGPHCCSILTLHGTVSLCCFQSQHACGPGPASVTPVSQSPAALGACWCHPAHVSVVVLRQQLAGSGRHNLGTFRQPLTGCRCSPGLACLPCCPAAARLSLARRGIIDLSCAACLHACRGNTTLVGSSRLSTPLTAAAAAAAATAAPQPSLSVSQVNPPWRRDLCGCPCLGWCLPFTASATKFTEEPTDRGVRSNKKCRNPKSS